MAAADPKVPIKFYNFLFFFGSASAKLAKAFHETDVGKLSSVKAYVQVGVKNRDSSSDFNGPFLQQTF